MTDDELFGVRALVFLAVLTVVALVHGSPLYAIVFSIWAHAFAASLDRSRYG